MKKSNNNRLKTEIRCAIAVLCLLISIVFCVSSCSKKDGEGYTNVTGTITDSLTKAALAGAWFGESPTDTNRVFSDSLGRYSFASFGTVSKQVYASKNGYRTKTRLLPRVSGAMPGIDFELVRDSL